MIMAENYNWYALYVKSRHEFLTMDELKRKGVKTFLPFVKKMRQWKDRKKFVDFPLFPGYLFVSVKADPEEFVNVLKTRGAVSLISRRPGCPAVVADEEINSLKLMVESGEEIDIYPELKEGTAIRVKKGPLKGAIGKLEKKEDQHIFLVNIDILGRSVGVKVFADDIEPD